MIKINLALKKSATVGGGTGTGGPGGGGTRSRLGLTKLGRVNISFEDLKDLPNLNQIIIFIVCVAVVSWFLDDYKKEELNKANTAFEKAAAEKKRLQKELDGAKEYDAIKKSLEADELVIRTKLETIQKLVQDRTTPPKLLIALSGAIPKEVWLSDLQVVGDAVNLSGDALDFNQVSDFMRNLNESAYFRDVSLKGTQQSKDESGLDTAKFGLAVRRR